MSKIISAKAFAPANISCVFKIYSNSNPRWAGSYGFGFTLNEGVTVEASKSKKMEILFNNKQINFPTVKDAAEKLAKEKLRIRIKTNLPLGYGFGLSGASALATAYAANELLGLKKSKKELAIIAHTAEVENKTGLGDVVNQFYGGFCVKLKPSSHFIVKKLRMSEEAVYCRCFSKISTKSVISNEILKKRINSAASAAINKIERLIKHKKAKFLDAICISKKFADESNLLKNKKTTQAIKDIEKNGGNASMIMLGNAIFSDKPFKGANRYKISKIGAHLI